MLTKQSHAVHAGAAQEVLGVGGFMPLQYPCFVYSRILTDENVPRRWRTQERQEAGFLKMIHMPFYVKQNRVD